MKLASALRGASALSSLGLLLSIACGGDFRSSTGNADGGKSDGGKSNGGKSNGGKPSGGGSGATGDDSGAGGDGAGGAPGGGASGGGAPGGGTSGGGTAGKGGSASGGRAGHSNGGATAGGSTSTGGASGAGNNGGTGGNGTGGAAAGGAGGRDTSQHADDYNQKCDYDSKCSLVNDTSDACGCKTCLNAAISSSALAEWNADRKAFNCPIPICPGLPCPEMLAACAKGTCTARKPFVVDANNYDTACTKNSDCTTIPVGEICSGCQCALGAVSLTGLQQYQNDKAKVLCTPDPIVCSCAPPVGSAVCSAVVGGAGVCVFGSTGTD